MNVSCVQRCPMDISIHCNSLRTRTYDYGTVRLSCNEGSDKPGKMRMLVRVPPKDQDEVRLTLEKKYRITTETHILHATDTLNPNTCWCSSRRCCRGRGLNLARGEIFTASIGSVDLRFNLQSQPNQPHPPYPTVIYLPHPVHCPALPYIFDLI